MHTLPTDPHLAPPFRAPGVLAGVIVAHATILGLILAAPRTAPPPALPSPIHVRLIETAAETPPPVPAPPPPAVAPPRPPQSVPAPTPPVAAAPSTAPQAIPEPVPALPPAEPVASPAAAALPATPQPVPPPAPPLPPVVQPRFDAAYLDNPRPPYPGVSRRMGEEGEVRLRVQVDPAGLARHVEIQQGSGYPRLDQAALDTVRQWRFVPARQGDQPIAAWVIVPIQFTLRSQP